MDAVILISNRLAAENESDDIFIERLERLLEQLPKDVKLGFYECPVPYKRVLTPPILKYCISTGRFAFLKDTCSSVAMVIDGNWQLSGVDSAAKFDWDTAAYPQIFSEKAVWGASELLAIPNNKDADKVKAAQTFVKWLSDNSAEWALSGQIPANVKAQQAATKIKGIEAYNSELDYVKFLPAHKKSVKVFSSAAPSPILTAAQNAMLNDKDPAEITKQLESDINKVLAG